MKDNLVINCDVISLLDQKTTWLGMSRVLFGNIEKTSSQETFTCSKPPIETLENGLE